MRVCGVHRRDIREFSSLTRGAGKADRGRIGGGEEEEEYTDGIEGDEDEMDDLTRCA